MTSRLTTRDLILSLEEDGTPEDPGCRRGDAAGISGQRRSGPDLRVRLIAESFTAFTAPLVPGELVYRHVPAGVDDDDEVAEVTGAGFSLFLSPDALAELYAVVPDADGVVRGQWEDPKQFL
ncbi:hypothetical protein [Lentzea sp. NPDC004782]|uniref:hypothetical protein n=1 Tax=Lentzea sp. NPDC004782 TaxID=3154458 RepID=UPI0033A29541